MPDLFSRAFKETSLHGTVVFETRVSSHLHLPTPFNYLILNIADSCSRPASSQIPRGKMSNSTAARQGPGVDPTSFGLRSRCNHCHLLRRSCRNGTTTKPCDRCREKGVLCTFSAPGSFVDKHIPGSRIRENGKIIRVGKFVNKNGSCSTIVNKKYQADVQNEDVRTAANKDAELDPVSEQSQTLAEESEIEEATSEEIESKELKEYMTQGKRFTIFTHEQIYPQENSAMHAGDDLTARQRLGYELMAIHEHRSDVEDDEEDEE
jgi:hypothetical protein